MTVVVDASVIVAAFVGNDADGAWSASLVASEPLVAPHLLPAEVASMLRRSSHAGELSEQTAGLAYSDFLELPVQLFEFEPFASRVWELRRIVTSYDAWYVALAEAIDAPLATLDIRLIQAPGPRCSFLTPPEAG